MVTQRKRANERTKNIIDYESASAQGHIQLTMLVHN